MKNRIRLGISGISVSNKYKQQPTKFSGQKHDEKNINYLRNRSNSVMDYKEFQKHTNSSVSSSDLDDIFLNNLKLLNDEESSNDANLSISEESNSPNFNRYQSSLNVFIKPKAVWRHSSIVDYSYCNVIPISDSRSKHNNKKSNKNKNNINNVKSNKVKNNKESIYSSYEAIYDNLLYDGGCPPQNNNPSYLMSQSMTESVDSNGNNSYYNNYSDSDRTLKSASSHSISSTVSSLDSNENNSPVCNNNNNNNKPRPQSWYLPKGTSNSNQLNGSDKNIYNNNNNGDNPPNVIVSRPLGRYPPRQTPMYCSEKLKINMMNSSQQSCYPKARSHLTISPSCSTSCSNICYNNNNNNSNNSINNNNYNYNNSNGSSYIKSNNSNNNYNYDYYISHINPQYQSDQYLSSSPNNNNNNVHSQPPRPPLHRKQLNSTHLSRVTNFNKNNNGGLEPSSIVRPVSMTNLKYAFPKQNGDSSSASSAKGNSGVKTRLKRGKKET